MTNYATRRACRKKKYFLFIWIYFKLRTISYEYCVYTRLSFCVKWIITFKENKRENLSTSCWSDGDKGALVELKKLNKKILSP